MAAYALAKGMSPLGLIGSMLNRDKKKPDHRIDEMSAGDRARYGAGTSRLTRQPQAF